MDLPRSPEPGIAVRDLTVRYRNGHTALEAATFSIGLGSICALVGINGSGKSTLFKALMGFVRPTRGTVINSRYTGCAFTPQAPSRCSSSRCSRT